MGEREIHLWELPPTGIYVTLGLEEQKRLFSDVVAKFSSIAEFTEELRRRSAIYGFCCGKIAGNVCSWKQGGRKNIPLWVLVEACKIVSDKDVPENEEMCLVEAAVEYYQSAGKGVEIRGKFPIRVTPEFDAIVSHLMGDGTLGTCKSYASYKQKNELARRTFLQQLFDVFGVFPTNHSFEKHWQVCIPKPIALVIRQHYGLGDAGCLERRLPSAIKEKSEEYRLAALVAFIVDEGHLGDAVELYSANQKLLQDYRELCLGLGYRCSCIHSRKGNKTPNASHCFRISLKDCRKLLENTRFLASKFPTLDLAHKQEALREIVFRQSLSRECGVKGRDGATKQKLLSAIRDGVETTKQLSHELHTGGQTIREHLQKLEQRGLVSREKKAGNAIVWHVSSL